MGLSLGKLSLSLSAGGTVSAPPDVSGNFEMLKADGSSKMLKADGSSNMKKAN